MAIPSLIEAKSFKLYELQIQVQHHDWLRGILKFEPGAVVFEDKESFYLISQVKPRMLTNASYKFPNDDSRIKGHIKFIKEPQLWIS